VRRFSEDEGFLLASALSFGLLLCVAPFTLILFSAAGFLLESDEIATWVFDSLSVLVPAYGRQIGEILVVVTRERAVTGLVGAASLAIFASHVFSLTRTVLNRAFRVAEPRGLIHALALDVVAVLLVGGVVVVIAVAGVALVAMRSLAHIILPLPPLTVLHAALSLVGIYVLGMAVLFLVYRTFPSARPSGKAAAVAAVTVTVLWEVARFAFSLYVNRSGVYGRLYGSFGIGIAALVWIYYSSAIFVLGAELAAVLTARDRALRRRLLE
jgi:membrane protein